MDARFIWENYLLVEESVTLEFPSLLSVRNFKAALQVYRSRHNQKMKNLGFTDSLELGTIVCEVISTLPTGETQVVVSMKAEERKSKPRFKIISE